MGSDDNLYYLRSTNNGGSWESAKQIATDDFGCYFPDIFASGQYIHIAYIGMDQWDTYYVRNTNYGQSSNWGSSGKLVDGGNEPSISGYDSNVIVVIQKDGKIACKISTNNGGSWNSEQQVGDSAAVDVDAIWSSSDNIHVVWRGDAGDNLYYSYSENSGSSWSSKLEIVNFDYCDNPSVTYASKRVHVVWRDDRNNGDDAGGGKEYGDEIYYKRSDEKNENPIATIDSISPNPADEGETVHFRGHGTDSDGTVEAWEWSSDIDGVFATTEDTDYSGLSTGTHTISYRVQDDSDDWSEYDTDTLEINKKPTATIDSISPNPANEGQTIQFRGSSSDSDGTIEEWKWRSSRDDIFGTLEDVDYDDLSVGSHTIYFSVRDDDGAWSDEVSDSLTVNNVKPTATIDSISPSPANEGQTVQFRGSGSDAKGSIQAYEWKSNIDDVFSTDEDPDYSDLSVGTHTISFRVRDDEGTWSDPDTESLTINNVKPTATIDSITPSPVAQKGETVQFRGTGSDAKGSIQTYEWSSDKDGVFSDEEDPDYDGLSVDTHEISFRVQDDEGEWSDTDTDTLRINDPPVVTIDSISPSPANEGEEINFRASASDSDGTIEEWEWSSDRDGIFSNEENPNFDDLSVGTHTICLRVRDNDDAWSDPVCDTLTINDVKPTATIDSILPYPANEGETVQFRGTGSDAKGSIQAYEWSSDKDGVFSTEENPDFDDLSVDTHEISFRVQDDEGTWSDPNTETLTIDNVKPTATIDSISPSPADEGQTVQLRGSGSDAKGDIQAYEWSSDRDGVFSTDENPDFDDLSVDTHEISFRVQDDEGKWSDPNTKTLTINNVKPTATIGSISPKAANEGQIVKFFGNGSDIKGTVQAYEWKSDKDGVLSTGKDFSCNNLSANIHTISFKAQDDEGEWSTKDTDTVTVDKIQNTPPTINLAAPSDEAANINTKPTLQWTADDSDASDSLTFDVYLDTDSNPVALVADGITNKTFTTEKLTKGRTYYWKVVVSDGENETTSEIWSFDVEKPDDDSDDIMGFSPAVVIGFVILIVIIGIFGVSHVMTRNLIKLKRKGDGKNGNS